ncbi:MAG: 2-C-methyl-D-erythritol 4-phosphate cytidylyltransferase [Nitrospinae bacterium]|nr:2-C-methyl-D-erythritol 4-phosphate cytidylyltransferase [Nitrospinota bacterium]
MSRTRCAAIIPAAGRGLRMGGKEKQFLALGGVPIIVRTLRVFETAASIDAIYLVVPKDKVAYCEKEIVQAFNLKKVIKVVAGGEERQDSVANALKLSSAYDIIVVHDGVRPFVTEKMITESIEGVLEYGVAVVAIPETDTVKEADKEGFISKEISRERLWRIQTPQTFKRELLEEAMNKANEEGFKGTDESSLIERGGGRVKIIEGNVFNIKITVPEDIPLGEAILRSFQV